MAKRSKPPVIPPEFIANQFKPGQSGNPGGMTKQQAKIRKLTKQQFSEVAEIIVQGNWEALKLVESSPDSTVIQKLMAKALLESHKAGDWGMLDRLLDRLIGKAKDDVSVTFLKRVVRKLDGTAVEYTNEPDDE